MNLRESHNLTERVKGLHRFLNARSLVIDSPDVTTEKQRDGRVLLRPNILPGAVVAPQPPVAELTCFGGRGGTLVVASPGVVEVQVLGEGDRGDAQLQQIGA